MTRRELLQNIERMADVAMETMFYLSEECMTPSVLAEVLRRMVDIRVSNLEKNIYRHMIANTVFLVEDGYVIDARPMLGSEVAKRAITPKIIVNVRFHSFDNLAPMFKIEL